VVPKYLQVLITLVCLVVLVPIALEILAGVAMGFGIVLLAIVEYADSLGHWVTRHEWEILFAALAVVFIGWKIVRARNRPTPGASAPVSVGIPSPRPDPVEGIR
jgi:hypothetical protein